MWETKLWRILLQNVAAWSVQQREPAHIEVRGKWNMKEKYRKVIVRSHKLMHREDDNNNQFEWK